MHRNCVILLYVNVINEKGVRAQAGRAATTVNDMILRYSGGGFDYGEVAMNRRTAVGVPACRVLCER
jgi:hypothetical protein